MQKQAPGPEGLDINILNEMLRLPFHESSHFQVGKVMEGLIRRRMYNDAPPCATSPEMAPCIDGHGMERPRGVIVFLLVELDTQDAHSRDELRRDLTLAVQCWSHHLPGYPLLIFHTRNIPESVLRRLKDVAPAGTDLEFAVVEADFPESIRAVGIDRYFEGRCINSEGVDRWKVA